MSALRLALYLVLVTGLSGGAVAHVLPGKQHSTAYPSHVTPLPTSAVPAARSAELALIHPMHMPPSLLLPSGIGTRNNWWSHVNRTCLLTAPHTCNDSLNLAHLRHIGSYMRTDVDPCVDFYAYACGNWRREHAAGAGASAMLVGGMHMNQRYVALFEQRLRTPHANDLVFEKLLQYYAACKSSESATRRLDLGGYVTRLAAHGLTPRARLPWLELLAHLARYGYGGHFVQIDVKQKNTTSHYVLIEPHQVALTVNLSLEVYAALANYTQYDHGTLRREFSKLESELKEIVVNATPDVDYDTMERIDFAQLVNACADVDWQRALTTQFGSDFDGTHELYIDGLPAIKQLVLYLNQINPELLTIYTYARFLNYLQAQPHSPLMTGASGLNCVRHMRKTLYLAMNYAYEQAYYAPKRAESERIIYQVFADLKRQFARTLRKNEMRLSAELIGALQSKLQAVRLNVGNLPKHVTREFYFECVRHMTVTDNFYENHLQSLLHFYTHLTQLEHDHKRETASAWYTFNHHEPDMLDNIDATPYFYCLSNMIIVPLAYIQLPFFDAHFWPALVYGDLANTLGHELIHAFDHYFVDYDAAGNLADLTTELERSPFYMRNLNCLNDSTTQFLNERIADISGSRLALHTYLSSPQYRRANGQLYFLQSAQFFCGDDSDEFHDTGSKRINYTLAQMPEFAEVFNCPVGSPMNPAHKCTFW